MRKSVSFHEEDPQVVFEYPPASDSSEDGYTSDDNEEFCQNIDYLKYAGKFFSFSFIYICKLHLLLKFSSFCLYILYI